MVYLVSILTNCNRQVNKTLLACLHNQNKSGFFEGSAFIQSIREI